MINKLAKNSCKLINLIFSYFFFSFRFVIMKKRIGFPVVLGEVETAMTIFTNGSQYSVSRFGDGEFNLILGIGNGFQKYNIKLAERLVEVLRSSNENHLIAIPSIFEIPSRMKLLPIILWRTLACRFYTPISKYLEFDRVYYNSLVTRPYSDYKNKKNSEIIFSQFKLFINNKKILIVEGKGTKFGVGNDLLNNSLSVIRIVCPNQHAYDYYNEIFAESIKVSQDYKPDIILISLGQTATVLSYDLSNIGYQCFDIGHLDIEYEWFLIGSKKKVLISGKSINELGVNYPDSTDISNSNTNYIKQIISSIDRF